MQKKGVLILFILLSILTVLCAQTKSATANSDSSLRAPLTGIKTIGVGGDYTTFTLAINDLNANGVGTGGVTFNATSAAYFVEDPPAITASGTVDNPIIFQKSGSVNAYLRPTGTAGTSDFGFGINGGDYITFDGINVLINSGNAVEFGFYLYNGATYNTIKNCSISLNSTNLASKGIYSYATGTTSGVRNIYNHYYNLSISTCACAVSLQGSTTAGIEDVGNEVGILPGGSTTISSINTATGICYAMNLGYQKSCVISNISMSSLNATASLIYGIYTAGTTSNIDLNGITINGVTGTTMATGIYIGGGSNNLYNNNVFNVTASAATGNATGINISGGVVNNLYNNSVHHLTCNGTTGKAYGISIASGTTNNIYNNFIYNLNTRMSSTSPSTVGLYITGGTNQNVYHNTILLSGTSGAVKTDTAGIYMYNSPIVDLRNNVIVNKTAVGSGVAGKAVALWRFNSPTFSNIPLTTNNNLYYAGIPGTQHLIYTNGTTNCLTLASYQALAAPRDASAVTENPPFVNDSTDPHVLNTIATQIESGGLPVTSPVAVTTDIDNQARSLTFPDLGADEGDFIISDVTGPSIAGTMFESNSSLLNRTLTNISISDFSGVDTASNIPRIYYKKSTDANVFGANDAGTNGWKWTETAQTSSPFEFLVDYTKLQTTPIVGDVIQYFLVAQDLVTTPNVGALPAAGFAATSVASITTAPTTPNSYTILTALSGIHTVGVGGEYPTLTAAIATYNASEIVGATEFHLLDTSYTSPAETFPLVLNQILGLSAVNTFTLKPAPGVTGINVFGNNATSIFTLNGADYVTIDGSNNGSSSSDLTIYNSSMSGSTILITAEAMNNTLKNCLVECGSNSGSSGVVAISTTANGNNNAILNCTLRDVPGAPFKPYQGIFLSGTSTGSQTIKNCTIFNVTNYAIITNNIAANGVLIEANNLYNFGNAAIYLYNTSNPIVTKNNIFTETNTTTSMIVGVYLYNTPGAVVTKNVVRDIRGSATAIIYGIYIGNASVASNTLIANNEISLETGVSTTSGSVYGIHYDSPATCSMEAYYNSIYIGGTGVTGTAKSYAMFKNTAANTFKLKDNVFVNARSNDTGTGKHYAIGINNSTVTTMEIDYNDYLATGVGGFLGVWSATDKATLAAWQASSTQDSHSQNADPSFTFGTHYLLPVTTTILAGTATPISGITDDIVGVNRDAVVPTIGAYEISLQLPDPAVLVSPADGAGPLMINLQLFWTSGPVAPTTYKLYFGTNNPPTNLANNMDLGMVTTFNPGTLIGGAFNLLNYSTTYYWQIVPTNNTGAALNCPVWSFTTMPNLQPPSNVTGFAGPHYVTINWNLPVIGTPVSYNIHRDGYIIANVPAPLLTYTDETGVPGVNYWYSISSVYDNPVFESVLHGYLSLTSLQGLNVPTGLTVALSSGNMFLDWNNVLGATTYNVWYADTPNAATWNLLGNTTNTFYTDTNPAPGARFYKITAVN